MHLRLALPSLAVLLALCPAVAAQEPPAAPPPARPVDAAARRLQLLVDAFHAAMPRDPEDLRRPDVRERIAATAIPAIRELDTWMLARGGADDLIRSAELGVYALALGDARYAAAGRDGSPDLQAQLRTAAAALVTAADSAGRNAAQAACAKALAAAAADPSAHAGQLAAGCTQALLRAAALSADEAEALAQACGAPRPAAQLRAFAAAARSDLRGKVGQPFVVAGKLRDGREFTSAALRGKVVLVDFWASWCAPCTRLLPTLAALRERFGDQGLEIVGVSCDRDAAALDAFLRDHLQESWPQLFDAAHPGWHALATELGIRSIPRLLLIDRRGVLRSADAQQELEQLVPVLLGEQG